MMRDSISVSSPRVVDSGICPCCVCCFKALHLSCTRSFVYDRIRYAGATDRPHFHVPSPEISREVWIGAQLYE